jgi:hypothetical protein
LLCVPDIRSRADGVGASADPRLRSVLPVRVALPLSGVELMAWVRLRPVLPVRVALPLSGVELIAVVPAVADGRVW